MRLFHSLLLYTALSLGANAATAEPVNITALEDLRTGALKKLNFHRTPKDASSLAYDTIDGGTGTLLDYQGQYVLLNFWATWCAPCRKEMPQLSALQTAMGGDSFQVVTLATGRNPPAAIKRFFAEIDVENLPLHRDPKQKIARNMAILGLPITVILNPEGQEIARLRGDADWSSESAKAILAALIAPTMAQQPTED